MSAWPTASCRTLAPPLERLVQFRRVDPVQPDQLPPSYSLRICFIRAVASSIACSGLMFAVMLRWIAFARTPRGRGVAAGKLPAAVA
jgi:hypothetical protein